MMTKRSLLLGAMLLGLAGATLGGVSLATTSAHAAAAERVREIEVVVDGNYRPGTITVSEGERVRLKFVRREYTPCTREVVFASLGIRKELPPNEPVVIELPPLAVGEHEFKCGMNMLSGSIVVTPRS